MDWSSLAVPAGAVGAALLALALMASAVIVWSLKPLTRWRLRRLPGPRPDWLFGNLLQIKELGLHEQRVRWQREYGKVFVWWQASKPIVIVADPDGARKVGLAALPVMQPSQVARHSTKLGCIWMLERGSRGSSWTMSKV